MSWQPEAGPLGQLTQCLHDSLAGHDRNAQANAETMLKQAKQSPDINNYLVYLSVTANPPDGLKKESWRTARTAGAIMLKNSVRVSYKSMPEASKLYLKSNIAAGLQDPDTQIRNYVGNVVTEVVRQAGVPEWPQLLPDLISMVANETGRMTKDAQDGAMSALFKVCEDNKRALDDDTQTRRPLTFLLPKLLEFTASPEEKVRRNALSSINVFLSEPVALTAREHISHILPRIVQLTSDSDEDVRKFVCRSFALLADAMPDVLLPHMQGIVDYTISQQRLTDNADVALEASEFFFEASNTVSLRNALGPYLDKIVPVLLDSMIYAEDDQIRLEGDNDDADAEDEAKDIKPHFATTKATRNGGLETNNSMTSQLSNGQSKPSINGYAYEDDDELSEGEIGEDGDFDIDPEDEWNLRKCSAAALDSLALHYGAPVFTTSLPWLTEHLQQSDWPSREAAVLALGAIGPGCLDKIKPHLPQLVPYMISLLTDAQPVVRQITCWALSRYAGWASQLEQAGKQQFFEPMMDGILKLMLDNNKKVQESAASAFATLEEAAKEQLLPYCQVILQQFVECFNRYKDKNMFILYDCVQTLSEYAGMRLAEPELVDLLMPTIMSRWDKVQDTSQEMFPLLECLAYIAAALGAQFDRFAEPIFSRCIRIIQQNLEDGAKASENGAYLDEPDKDFLVTSLDLLSAIVQALDESRSIALVAGAQPNMFELLAYCMKDDNDDVKQSAYALLGDCAIYIFPQLQQYLPALLELVITQLDPNLIYDDSETASRVLNNACWSCGEIAMRHSAAMAPYVDRLLSKLAVIMFSEKVPPALNENAAIALGRLGIGCHQQLAPHLSQFAVPFLSAMRKIDWTDEKGHAYKGFSLVVLDNPQALENGLLDFFMEMASAPGLFLTGMQDSGPLEGFERVLAEYKGLLGNNWDGFLSHLPQPQQQSLRQLYSF